MPRKVTGAIKALFFSHHSQSKENEQKITGAHIKRIKMLRYGPIKIIQSSKDHLIKDQSLMEKDTKSYQDQYFRPKKRSSAFG